MAKQFDIFRLEAPDFLTMHWGWSIALGCMIAVLGIAAIWKANTTTKLFVRFLGALAVLSALAVLFFSFTVAGLWTEFFVHVLWAVGLGVVGLIMVFEPDVGAEAITLIIAFYFLISGILTIGFAFSAHIDNLWIYVSGGLMNLILGLILVIGWPISGMWAIGIFIGVDLLLKGCTIAAMGLSLRAISEG